MQVNNVRIYLDSSSFFPGNFFDSWKFFGFFAGLFAFSLGKPGRINPDPDPNPTRSSPTGPEPDPKHRTIVTCLWQQVQRPPGQVPAAAKKANNNSLKKPAVDFTSFCLTYRQ